MACNKGKIIFEKRANGIGVHSLEGPGVSQVHSLTAPKIAKKEEKKKSPKKKRKTDSNPKKAPKTKKTILFQELTSKSPIPPSHFMRLAMEIETFLGPLSQNPPTYRPKIHLKESENIEDILSSCRVFLYSNVPTKFIAHLPLFLLDSLKKIPRKYSPFPKELQDYSLKKKLPFSKEDRIKTYLQNKKWWIKSKKKKLYWMILYRQGKLQLYQLERRLTFEWQILKETPEGLRVESVDYWDENSETPQNIRNSILIPANTLKNSRKYTSWFGNYYTYRGITT
ncbi:MAG: hypothetical protein D6785_05645, partial [Planctomycetota bacterium]